MIVIWKSVKYGMLIIIAACLLLTSAIFSVLLYGMATGKEWARLDDGLSPEQAVLAGGAGEEAIAAYDQEDDNPYPLRVSITEIEEEPAQARMVDRSDTSTIPLVLPVAAMLDAPVYSQYPELYNGCEVTSLAMLLNYYGIEKSKLELALEVEKDPTPVQLAADGSIRYWGNPNTGFVGDVTGKSMGFGIFHGPLLKLMEQYIPSGVDLTGASFQLIEQQVASGFPVVVWTTNDFAEPQSWIVWDTPLGPIQTTMKEHAVLVVGYDEDHVYVNDPMTGKAKTRVEKERFIKAWEAMGKQAISYTEPMQMEGEV